MLKAALGADERLVVGCAAIGWWSAVRQGGNWWSVVEPGGRLCRVSRRCCSVTRALMPRVKGGASGVRAPAQVCGVSRGCPPPGGEGWGVEDAPQRDLVDTLHRLGRRHRQTWRMPPTGTRAPCTRAGDRQPPPPRLNMLRFLMSCADGQCTPRSCIRTRQVLVKNSVARARHWQPPGLDWACCTAS